jgi:DNA-binding protein YbaB
MKRAVFGLAALALLASADTLKLRDGSTVSGIVRSIEGGKVSVEVNGSERTINVLEVEQMVFDTPHQGEAAADITVREFTRAAQNLTKAQREARAALDQIQNRWRNRRTVEPNQLQQWNAERERFATPLEAYRRAIIELYRDVAAHVDNYNRLAGEAHRLYVGVRGLLNTGAPLVSEEQRELPLRSVLPGRWFEQLYYEAYSKGFKDAVEFERLTPR